MKRILFIVLFIGSWLGIRAQQELLGEWKTVDDKTGKYRSVVSIYKGADGLYYGKILRLLEPEFAGKGYTCVACKGEDKNKLIEGLVIIKGLKYADGKLKGGTILDPESGNVYYVNISLDSPKKLRVRGSLDSRGFLGRSQYWLR